MTNLKTRCYSELLHLETFEERFEYLSMPGVVGQATFGFDRWMNQQFYSSWHWKGVRRSVILRDNGCDLGIEGLEVHWGLLVHHMNPIVADDIASGQEWIVDPEFLITTSKRTHNAIHYGDASQLLKPPVERQPGDTRLW